MIKDFEDLCVAGTYKEIAVLKGICERLGRQPIAEIEKAQEFILGKVNG